MSKPSAPAPPDYRAAAVEQGQANLQAGQQTSVLSNPNIHTPYGQQNVTYGQNVMGVQQPTVTQTFSPEQQKLYDQQVQLSQNLNNTAISGLGRVNDMMNTDFDMSRFSPVSSVDFSSLPNVRGYDSSGFNEMRGYDNSSFQNMNGIDLSQLDPRTVQGSVGGLQMVADAIRAREAPRFEQQRSATEANLLAQGHNPGGRGYDARVDELGRQRNDFDLGALLAAGQEQSRLFGLESQGRAQGLTEQAARLQGDLGIRGQQAGEEAMRLQGDLGIRGQQSQEMRDQFSADAAMRNMSANEQLRLQQSQGDERARQIQEALFARQLPLNEINALRTGNQATLPQFQQFSGAQVGAAPIYGAAQDQFSSQFANYSQKLGTYNNMMGGLFDLGASALGGGFGGGIG